LKESLPAVACKSSLRSSASKVYIFWEDGHQTQWILVPHWESYVMWQNK